MRTTLYSAALTILFVAPVHAAGVQVTSARGEGVQFTPTVRNIFVVDPNGLNIELFESKP